MEVSVNTSLINFIEENCAEEFKKVQVNNNIKFAREAYFAVQLLQKNDYSMNVARKSPGSLRSAVINVATIGLSLNPALAQAYLVPRKNAIYLDISYQGLLKLATDTGSILWAQAEIVYQNDNFALMGAGKAPKHEINPFSTQRGEKIGAYVTVKTVEGDYLTTAMSIEDVFKIRDMSEAWKAYKSGKTKSCPWVDFEDEMIKKTVIKRASKLWPKTDKNHLLEKAITVLNEHEGIDFKSEYQKEKEAIDEDFPIPPEEKEIGSPDYRIQNAKYRGKKLSEIDEEELADYLDTLEKRLEKRDGKGWELEVSSSIRTYLMNMEEAAQAF